MERLVRRGRAPGGQAARRRRRAAGDAWAWKLHGFPADWEGGSTGPRGCVCAAGGLEALVTRVRRTPGPRGRGLAPRAASLLLPLILSSIAPAASATMIAASPSVEILLAPPASVVAGDLESDSLVFAFQERADQLLLSDLFVDISLPGTYDAPGDAFATSAFLPAGTRVNSYLLHFDQTGGWPDVATISGWVSFDEEILGLIVLPGHGDVLRTLEDTDPILGAPGTVYPFGPEGDFRGLEELGAGDPPAADALVLSADRHRLDFTFRTFAATDQVRIITLVPEPSTWILLGLGAAGLAALRPRGVRAD